MRGLELDVARLMAPDLPFILTQRPVPIAGGGPCLLKGKSGAISLATSNSKYSCHVFYLYATVEQLVVEILKISKSMSG